MGVREKNEGQRHGILEAKHFRLYAQPILDIEKERISRYELLLRLAGPSGSVLLPEPFIRCAEGSDLIHAVDRWVVRQAIGLIAEHDRSGLELCLQVNVSSRALCDRRLLRVLEGELARASIKPGSLILEITETADIPDMRIAQELVELFRMLGCGVALDDFGAGYSSFEWLKHLRVDYLKIDGSYVSGLPDSPVNQELVMTMLDAGRRFGLRVVAEFVEDEETLCLFNSRKRISASGKTAAASPRRTTSC